ncbi:MAG: hypothetical protein ACYS32_11310, partial [Planctomycetota bacterium]
MYQLASEIDNPDAWNAFALEYKTIDSSTPATEIEEAEKHNAGVKDKLGKPVDAKEYSWRIWSKRTRY